MIAAERRAGAASRWPLPIGDGRGALSVRAPVRRGARRAMATICRSRMREGADPKVLLEVRRALGRPFAVDSVAADAFDRLLGDRYAMDGQATALAAVGMGDELDMLAERPADRRGSARHRRRRAGDPPDQRHHRRRRAQRRVATSISSRTRPAWSCGCGSTACCARRCACRRTSRRSWSAASR